MSKKNDSKANQKSAKVIQLGFNISVSGDSDTDIQFALDEIGQGTGQSIQYEIQNEHSEMQGRVDHMGEKYFENDKKSDNEVKSVESLSTNPKSNAVSAAFQSDSSSNESAFNKPQNLVSNDVNLVSEIKSAMENFEKFSDRIKEIPRFKNYPIATSTPFSSKQNSKSESSLMHLERRPRRYAHLYDFKMRKKKIKETKKSSPSDLFLKPLPGENLYRGSIVKRCDYEPFRIYGSVDCLTKTMDYSKSALLKSNRADEKNEFEEWPHGILKKSDSESGDKSISSADTSKDIKIYQNGGILIMQNFKDDFDEIFIDSKREREISELSAKLIENYNKLKEEISGDFRIAKEKNSIGDCPDEIKSSGKTVQFDIREIDHEENKFGISQDFASKKNSLVDAEFTSDFVKDKENLQGTLQSCQDFPSMSTQENDSIFSNPPENSPGASGKKLEWDSGADVGYLNLDLTKENLSTIERIVLKGLSGDGMKEKSVVFEKNCRNPNGEESPFILLERRPSNFFEIEKIAEEAERSNFETDGNGESDSSKTKTAEMSRGRNRAGKMETKKIDGRENGGNDKIDGIPADASRSEKNSYPLEFGERKKSEVDFSRNVDAPIKSKLADSVDKSVNVNTLFDGNRLKIPFELSVRNEQNRHCENFGKIKSHKQYSPAMGKKYKKKMANQRNNPTAALKEKIESIIEIARHSNLSLEISKRSKMVRSKTVENVEREPERQRIGKTAGNDRFEREESRKSAMECQKGKDDSPAVGNAGKNKMEVETNPTTSINRNVEIVENGGGGKKMAENFFVDEIVQTSNVFDVESIGIQAFSSRESSKCNFSSSRHEDAKVVERAKKNADFRSKSIQAYGLNSSLPMELSHPKEAKFGRIDSNTKGTQFYGGPINSLPNYHRQPVERCGRMPKVLKAKANVSTEVKEENKKNILANRKNGKKCETPEGFGNGKGEPENKENLLEENLFAVVPSRTVPSVDSEDSSKNVDREGEKKTDDDMGRGWTRSGNPSWKFLTRKILEERGDVVDRNLIKDKYFRSQLAEIAKAETTSKGTSMENPFGGEFGLERWEGEGGGVRAKKSATVACQYSSCSKEEISDEGSLKIHRRKESSDRDSEEEEEEEECLDTSRDTNQDTFPSSTQTAHSWIPGARDSSRKEPSAVGRARSFEYLPGHIYESSGNLRLEKLPSENDRDVITGSSSDSSKRESKKEEGGSSGGTSEGRKTLVLENSNDVSGETSGLKNLNENLTQLNIVVTKLKEKDVQIQNVTRSLLINFWKQNGSGDNFDDLVAREKSKTEIFAEKKNDSMGEIEKERETEAARKSDFIQAETDADVSIACQTDVKSSGSSLEKLKEERKSLENRIAADKENQIKWIEKEIQHLNVLRGLLERENSSANRRKKASNWTISSGNVTEKDDVKNSAMGEIRSNSVTPVYGCTISLTDPAKGFDGNRPVSGARTETEANPTGSECAKYGMAVSVNGNLRKVLLLPVGVQVSLKNSNYCESGENVSGRGTIFRCCPSSVPEKRPSDGSLREETAEECHCDAGTQHPSGKWRTAENYVSASVQTDSPEMCIRCRKWNCVCLEFSESEKSSGTTDRRRLENPKKASGRNDGFEAAVENVDPGYGNKTADKMSPKFAEKANGNTTESTSDSVKEKRFAFVCKCENCPERTSGRNQRRSSAFADREKFTNRIGNPAGNCRCSKVQVETSSACACHVIKIHGPVCLTSNDRNGSCSCKKWCGGKKKTENQFCQTDETATRKTMAAKHGDVAKSTRIEEITDPSSAYENPCDPRHADWMKVGTDGKRVSVGKNAEGNDAFADGKSTFSERVCCCKKKGKPKMADDHPRRYFLKIEETEVEGSNESLEGRNSLEVITVKVPVKKSGKGKIDGNNFGPSKSRQGQNETGPFNCRQALNACCCCKDCLGRKCGKWIRDMKNFDYRKDDDDDEREGGKKKERNGREIDRRDREFEKFRQEEMDREISSVDATRPSSASQENERGKNVALADSSKSKRRNGWRDPRCDFRPGDEDEKRNESESGEESGCRNCHCFDETFKRSGRNGERRDRFRATGREKVEGGAGSREPQQRQISPESDYYNYNKREFMTKSELRKEEENKKEKKRIHHLSLQESLASNRPDFCDSAERRRRIISEKAKERVNNHRNRMDCLINLLHQCEKTETSKESKRIFTTPQMREQTMKRYRTLPEVTEKAADQRKKEEYRTNKLMGDIFSKKLQRETLKGHTNLSNSVSVLSTI